MNGLIRGYDLEYTQENIALTPIRLLGYDAAEESIDMNPDFTNGCIVANTIGACQFNFSLAATGTVGVEFQIRLQVNDTICSEIEYLEFTAEEEIKPIYLIGEIDLKEGDIIATYISSNSPNGASLSPLDMHLIITALE